VRRSNEEIRANNKGRIDVARVRAATEEQIARWKAEDGIDDATLGPPRFINAGPDAKRIREKMQLSQEDFARRFHLSLRTVQEWEQQRRVPDGPGRTLLRVIEHEPEAVERALEG
jgi:putative transcriptional regulator